jgi:hypothetical protein
VARLVDAAHAAIPDDADESVLIVDDETDLRAHHVGHGAKDFVRDSHESIDERALNSSKAIERFFIASSSESWITASKKLSGSLCNTRRASWARFWLEFVVTRLYDGRP